MLDWWRGRNMVLTSPRALLYNGILMSACFAGLEGCIIATINLSAAIISTGGIVKCSPHGIASMANGVLYLFFSLSSFIAPPIVDYLGAKRTMILAMALYSLYLAAYIVANPILLLINAGIGGTAGACLWVAQGVYFTRNAQAYDAARRAVATPARFYCIGRDSITAFAGIFAVTFQLVTTLAKPTAAVLLTLYPDDRTVLFAVLTAAGAVCTLAMCLVAPMRKTTDDTEQPPPPSLPPSPPPSHSQYMGANGESPSITQTAAPAPQTIGLVDVPIVEANAPPPRPPRNPSTAAKCCGDRNSNLLLLFCDSNALLITPYNAAFGLSTAFFPSHVTVLTKAVFSSGGDAAQGAAAVGWMYTIAGLSSAVIAAASAIAAQRFQWARSLTMLLGSAAFSTACFLAALGGKGTEADTGCPDFSTFVLGAMFLCYGLGVAAWQGSCMALIGDLFREDPRAAFAHLKLTSGICSFIGFFTLPLLSLRRAALVTLATNAFGALGFIALLVRRRAEEVSSTRASVAEVTATPFVRTSG